MRWITIAVILACTAQAHAWDSADISSIDMSVVCRPGPQTELERRLCLKRRYTNARARRMWGQGLSITGAVPVGLGAALALVTHVECSTQDCGEFGGVPIVLGGFLALVGAPLLAVGVPLWVDGRKHELRLRPMADFNADSGRIGLVLEF